MHNCNRSLKIWQVYEVWIKFIDETEDKRTHIITSLPFTKESEVTVVPPLGRSLAATAADLRANLGQLKASTEEAWNNLQDVS